MLESLPEILPDPTVTATDCNSANPANGVIYKIKRVTLFTEKVLQVHQDFGLQQNKQRPLCETTNPGNNTQQNLHIANFLILNDVRNVITL